MWTHADAAMSLIYVAEPLSHNRLNNTRFFSSPQLNAKPQHQLCKTILRAEGAQWIMTLLLRLLAGFRKYTNRGLELNAGVYLNFIQPIRGGEANMYQRQAGAPTVELLKYEVRYT